MTVTLTELAGDRGLPVRAGAAWPEPGDAEVPALAGFVVSSFSPLVAAVAERCLTRAGRTRNGAESSVGTAVVLASGTGDLPGALAVAAAVDAGTRVRPLMFFQSVPNAVAGYVAARWGLRGPVVCLADAADAVGVAALLLDDGDADAALIVRVETPGGAPERDSAHAVLVTAPAPTEGERR
jgi:3-oxoacyl-(acyl-carrier-protein) synthase